MNVASPPLSDTDKLLAQGPLAAAKAYQDILKKIKGGEILTPSELKSLDLLEKKLKGSAAENTPETAPTVKSLEELAQHLHRSTRTVRRWLKKGMPRLSNGGFDPGQVVAWVAKREGKSGPGPAESPEAEGEANSGKDYWEMRGKKAQAEQRELDLRVRQGELIELTELEALLTPRAMVYRQGLVAFEQNLPPRLIAALGLPPESLRVLNAVIRQVAGEVLKNVLRPLTLSSGQVLEWEKDNDIECR